MLVFWIILGESFIENASLFYLVIGLYINFGAVCFLLNILWLSGMFCFSKVSLGSVFWMKFYLITRDTFFKVSTLLGVT